MSAILRGITQKDHKQVVRKALAAGCSIDIAGNGHVVLTTPDGTRIRTPLTGSRGSAMYLRQDLRRAGVVV